MPKLPTALRICLAATAASMAAASLSGQANPPKKPTVPYRAALQQYKKLVRQKSLGQRVEARTLLAQTRDPRAFKILSASYGKSEAPRDQVRHLLVNIVTNHLAIEEHRAALTNWRSDFDEAADAWLWFQTLGAPFMAAHMDEMLRASESPGDPFLRAAALQSMCEMIDGGVDQRPPVAASIAKILAKLPKDALEKSLLLEACAAVLYGQRRIVQQRTKPWRPITKTLIEALADRRLPVRSKQVLARYFARTFQLPNLGTDPQPWLDWLDGKPPPKRGVSTTSPGFFGVTALGTKICYVIDASDSMLEAVDEATKAKLEAIAKTGPGKDNPLAWDTIQTRFDLVLEFLGRALRGLGKGTRISVILFGNEAHRLTSTTKLVSANPTNVGKLLAELTELAAKRRPNRPNSTLLGATNLHAGMLKAFRTTRSRPIQRDDYVNRKLFADGCDTIYLLSDGEPDRDSFDKPGGGPFGRAPHDHLIADLRRLNLFRKVQIHCIGLGEAHRAPLARIAAIGFGTHLSIKSAK
ncbi:MAG: hypothetical protein VX951_04335 [Planctomycetota bacterium]|nr:hypothetical protein [Planctomycetota bacterium]